MGKFVLLKKLAVRLILSLRQAYESAKDPSRLRSKQESPGSPRAIIHCIQYSGWNITHTPRESSGLARRFVIKGLDRFSDQSWLYRSVG